MQTRAKKKGLERKLRPGSVCGEGGQFGSGDAGANWGKGKDPERGLALGPRLVAMTVTLDRQVSPFRKKEGGRVWGEP